MFRDHIIMRSPECQILTPSPPLGPQPSLVSVGDVGLTLEGAGKTLQMQLLRDRAREAEALQQQALRDRDAMEQTLIKERQQFLRLQTKSKLSSAAQRSARGMEKDYEEVWGGGVGWWGTFDSNSNSHACGGFPRCACVHVRTCRLWRCWRPK